MRDSHLVWILAAYWIGCQLADGNPVAGFALAFVVYVAIQFYALPRP